MASFRVFLLPLCLRALSLGKIMNAPGRIWIDGVGVLLLLLMLVLLVLLLRMVVVVGRWWWYLTGRL